MFGRRKKKYIKEYQGLSVKAPNLDQNSTGVGQVSPSKESKYTEPAGGKRKGSELEKLMYEDSILITVENSPLDKKSIPADTHKEIKSFSQKPASRVLNLIALVLVFKLGSFLLNADFLKVNSIIYIFILFVPFILGVTLIYTAVFHLWKHKVTPMARVVSRKVFKYWYLILLLIYLIYVKNVFDQLV